MARITGRVQQVALMTKHQHHPLSVCEAVAEIHAPFVQKVKLFCVRTGGQSTTRTGMTGALNFWVCSVRPECPVFTWFYTSVVIRLSTGSETAFWSCSDVQKLFWKVIDWQLLFSHIWSSLGKVSSAELIQVTCILSATAYYKMH